MTQFISNKERAVQFLQLTATGKADEAYERFVDQDFIHHNQYFKGDRQSLLLAMKENHLKIPNKVFETQMAIEESDRVMTYSRVQMGDMQIAVVHIMKFKNEKIIELWDLGQQISKDSPNENGMF